MVMKYRKGEYMGANKKFWRRGAGGGHKKIALQAQKMVGHKKLPKKGGGIKKFGPEGAGGEVRKKIDFQKIHYPSHT